MNDKELLKLKTLFIQVFNNEPGYKVLQFIMHDLCGFQSANVCYSSVTGDLVPNAMLHNEGRRGVYLDIRRFLSEDILKRVELNKKYNKSSKSKDTKQHPYLNYRPKSESD